MRVDAAAHVVLRRSVPSGVAMVLLVLAGCGRGQGNRAPEGGTTPSAPVAAADSTSPARAAAWIQDYYKAIDEHRYRDAYAHWEQGGQASGKSFDEFQRGFEETGHVEVTVGTPGSIGAAAGSRYVEVPVRIVARTRNGEPQSFSGSYTLRLSVVDGATPEQRTWHIYFAAIRRA